MTRKFRKLWICVAFLLIIFTVMILHLNEPVTNDSVGFREQILEITDESTFFEDLGRAIPNIPEDYLTTKTTNRNYNSSCARYPKLVDLHYNNLYWQTAYVSDSTLHILGAYLDNRVGAGPGGSVRILVAMDTIEYSKTNAYCQIWFEDSKTPTIVNTTYNLIWFKQWGSVERGRIFALTLLLC